MLLDKLRVALHGEPCAIMTGLLPGLPTEPLADSSFGPHIVLPGLPKSWKAKLASLFRLDERTFPLGMLPDFPGKPVLQELVGKCSMVIVPLQESAKRTYKDKTLYTQYCNVANYVWCRGDVAKCPNPGGVVLAHGVGGLILAEGIRQGVCRKDIKLSMIEVPLKGIKALEVLHTWDNRWCSEAGNNKYLENLIGDLTSTCGLPLPMNLLPTHLPSVCCGGDKGDNFLDLHDSTYADIRKRYPRGSPQWRQMQAQARRTPLAHTMLGAVNAMERGHAHEEIFLDVDEHNAAMKVIASDGLAALAREADAADDSKRFRFRGRRRRAQDPMAAMEEEVAQREQAEESEDRAAAKAVEKAEDTLHRLHEEDVEGERKATADSDAVDAFVELLSSREHDGTMKKQKWPRVRFRGAISSVGRFARRAATVVARTATKVATATVSAVKHVATCRPCWFNLRKKITDKIRDVACNKPMVDQKVRDIIAKNKMFCYEDDSLKVTDFLEMATALAPSALIREKYDEVLKPHIAAMICGKTPGGNPNGFAGMFDARDVSLPGLFVPSAAETHTSTCTIDNPLLMTQTPVAKWLLGNLMNEKLSNEFVKGEVKSFAWGLMKPFGRDTILDAVRKCPGRIVSKYTFAAGVPNDGLISYASCAGSLADTMEGTPTDPNNPVPLM